MFDSVMDRATKLLLPKTHYEMLNVSESATYTQIKAAYRTLMLQNHPDKQKQRCDDDDPLDEDEYSKRLFLQIQNAWECLRDTKTRKEYNQMLQTCRDKHRSQTLYSSSMVYLSQMKRDRRPVRMEEEEVLQSCIVLTYPCRCGDEFQVWDDELEVLDQEKVGTRNDPPLDENIQDSKESPFLVFNSSNSEEISSSYPATILSCPSCSLSIQIVNDIL